MMKEISKDEIPDWQYGNITVKTYSYGNTVLLSDMIEIKKTIVDGKEESDYKLKNGFKDSDVNILMLAAGIHFVRSVDGVSFALKPESDIETKKRFAFDIDKNAALFILSKIKELNEGVTSDIKKR